MEIETKDDHKGQETFPLDHHHPASPGSTANPDKHSMEVEVSYYMFWFIRALILNLQEIQIVGLIISQVAVWVLHYPVNSAYNYSSNPLHITHSSQSCILLPHQCTQNSAIVSQL